MITRLLQKEAEQALKRQPAVVITGPRQVGKSTLAKALVNKLNSEVLFLDLELPSDQLKLTDAEQFLLLHKDKCIVLDEAQLKPELFSLLRPLIDADRRPGRYLLTGSASPQLVQGLSESLAGRVAYLELSPIGQPELPKNLPYEQHWFRGGFPDALLAESDDLAIAWLDDFIRSYIGQDFNRIFGINLSPTLVQRFWQMLAHNTGGLWNGESYARSLGVSGPTVSRYLDYLEGAYMVRRLQPWHTNMRKRLVKSPKIYLRDSGLLHRLASIYSLDELYGNVLIGGSWEGYVIEQILQQLPASVQPYFFRTQDGAECDLVLIYRNKVWACIEIKFSRSARPSRGFYECLKALSPAHAWCIVPGKDEAFPIGDNVTVEGLSAFLQGTLSKVLP